jgi:hypothetical protein
VLIHRPRVGNVAESLLETVLRQRLALCRAGKFVAPWHDAEAHEVAANDTGEARVTRHSGIVEFALERREYIVDPGRRCRTRSPGHIAQAHNPMIRPPA